MASDEPTTSVKLEGDLAAAFLEWRYAATQLDGTYAAWTSARERHAIALARLTKLSTGTMTGHDGKG